MKVIIIFVGNLLTAIVRNLYWLFRLIRASLGNGFRFKWPVKVEGRGEITIGLNGFIGKNTHIGAGDQSYLYAGDNVFLGNQVTVMLKTGTSFRLGNDVGIEDFTRLYIQNNWEWGNGVRVATNCQLFSRENGLHGRLDIGDDTHIGDGTIIDASDDVIVGKEVAIGPYCIIYTHDHSYTDKDLPAWKGAVHTKKVIIHDGAWIGSRVTILPGVTIGRRAVVAAGAVVTKDIPPETVWGGIPARQIKVID